MLKVVIDTGVFIRGIIGKGSSRGVLEEFKKGTFILCISPLIYEEILGTIARAKFKEIISSEKIQEIADLIKERASFITPSEKIDIVRDKEDNKFIECALATKSKFLISTDKDLLSIKKYNNVNIITPHQFLKYLHSL
ncbi:MAG: putative toxin-antitoxin system toxin component, PIN family [Candidatus Omnitrophica bacterium]|nr:putative toxin-antitoxin system toxin component, PIN family [Candidatus Omnitrophota bacterium]